MSTVMTNDEGERKEFKEKTLAKVQALEAEAEQPEKVDPVEVSVPNNFHTLSDPELFGILKDRQLTPEQATLLLEQLRGRTPGTKEFKVILEAACIVETEPDIEPASPEYAEVEVEVPAGFADLRIKDQFYYLKNNLHLTIEETNDVMVALRGGTPLSFKVIITELPTVEFESVQAEIPEIKLSLPEEFKDFDTSYQMSYLRTESRLTPKQAADAMKVLRGASPDHFKVIIDFTSEVTPIGEQLFVAEEEEEIKFPVVEVELPENFGTFRPQDQYLYLKTHLHMTGDQANDIISAFNKQAPLKYQVILK